MQRQHHAPKTHSGRRSPHLPNRAVDCIAPQPLTLPRAHPNNKRAEECKFPAASSSFGFCNEEQRAAGRSVAEQLHGGAPMKMSPCDIFPYIRGRTLWLIG